MLTELCQIILKVTQAGLHLSMQNPPFVEHACGGGFEARAVARPVD